MKGAFENNESKRARQRENMRRYRAHMSEEQKEKARAKARENWERHRARERGENIPLKKRGRQPEVKMVNEGDMSDWRNWDTDGCLRLAAAVAEYIGDEYRFVLREQKKHPQQSERYEKRLEAIESMVERSFLGVFIDSKSAFARLRRMEADNEKNKRF